MELFVVEYIIMAEETGISDEKCKAANKKAKELNLLMDGDQACFI